MTVAELIVALKELPQDMQVALDTGERWYGAKIAEVREDRHGGKWALIASYVEAGLDDVPDTPSDTMA